MLVVRMDSPEGRRLSYEGRVLTRALRRLVKANGATPGGLDQDAQKLNFDLGVDIVGLIALRARIGSLAVTLISGPGVYFDPSRPERRLALDQLAAARRAQGRRAVVVSKHEILGRLPFDLTMAAHGSPPVARRNGAHALVATGRRAVDGGRVQVAEASTLFVPADVTPAPELRTNV